MSGQTPIGFGRGRARAPMIRRADGAAATTVGGSICDSQPPPSPKPAAACVQGMTETFTILEPASIKSVGPLSTSEADPVPPGDCASNVKTSSACSVTNSHVTATNSSAAAAIPSLASHCPASSATASIMPIANLSSQATAQTAPLTSTTKFHFYSAPVFVPPQPVPTTKNEFLIPSDKIAAVRAELDSVCPARIPEPFPKVGKDGVAPTATVHHQQRTATPQLTNIEAVPSRIEAQGHLTNSTNQSKLRITKQCAEVIPEERLHNAFNYPAKSSVPPETLSNQSKPSERESTGAHYSAGSIATLQKNLGAEAVGTPTLPKLRISNITTEQAHGDSTRGDKNPKANESSTMKHSESGSATAPPTVQAGRGSGRKILTALADNLAAMLPSAVAVRTPTPANTGKIAGVQSDQDNDPTAKLLETFPAACKGSTVPPATVPRPQCAATPQLANAEAALSRIEAQGHMTNSTNQSKPRIIIQRGLVQRLCAAIPAEKLRSAFDYPAKSSVLPEPRKQSEPKELISTAGEQPSAVSLPVNVSVLPPASANVLAQPSVVALTSSQVSLGASFESQQSSSQQNTPTPLCSHDRTAEFPAKMRDSLGSSCSDKQRPVNPSEQIDFQATACGVSQLLSGQNPPMQFGTSSDEANPTVSPTFSELAPTVTTTSSHIATSTNLVPPGKLLVEPPSQLRPTAVAAQEDQLPPLSATISKSASGHEENFKIPPLRLKIASTLVSLQPPSTPDSVPSITLASSVLAEANVKASFKGLPSRANASATPKPRQIEPVNQFAAGNCCEGAQKELVEKVGVEQPAKPSRKTLSDYIKDLPTPPCGVATRQMPNRTGATKFVPAVGREMTMRDNGEHRIYVRHQCITAQKKYEMKSFEELRLDYLAGRKGLQQSSSHIFGAATQTSQPSAILSSQAHYRASEGPRSFGATSPAPTTSPPLFEGQSAATPGGDSGTTDTWPSAFGGVEPCRVGRLYNAMYVKHPGNACLALLMMHHTENSGHAFCTGPSYFMHLSTAMNRADIALSILRHVEPPKLESIMTARMAMPSGSIAGRRTVPPQAPVNILTIAVQEQNLELLKWSFENGLKLSQRNAGIISVALRAKVLNETSVELIRLLTGAGAPIFSRHFEVAVAKRNIELLEILLANCSLSQAYQLSEKLINSCCQEQMMPYLKLFLNIHPNCFEPFGDKNVLVLAIENKASACVDEILNVSKRKLDRKHFAKFIQHHGDSALRLAFASNNLELAIALLKAGAGVHFFDKQNYAQLSNLLTAETMLRIVPAIQIAGVVGESILTRILFDMLRATNDNLEALQQARANSEQLSTALTALQSSHDSLQAEFAIAHTKAAKSSIAIQDRNREIEGLQKVSADNERLSTALSALQSSHECLQAECAAAHSKADSTNSELQQKSQELADTQKEKTKLLAEKASCEARMGTVDAQNVRLRAQLREKACKLGALHKEANTTAAEKRVLADEKEKLQKEVTGLRGDNANLAAQIEALNEQLAQQPGTSQQPGTPAASAPNCGICYDDFAEDRRRMALPCGHVYCSVCVPTVVTNARGTGRPPCCPFCRKAFHQKSVLKLLDTSAP